MALAIFTALIVTLQRGTAGSLRAIRLATMDQRALDLARAKLATASVEGIAAEAVEEGDDAGLHWRTSIRRYKAPDEIVMPPGLAAYWVNVSVDWRPQDASQQHEIELQTLKLRAAP